MVFPVLLLNYWSLFRMWTEHIVITSDVATYHLEMIAYEAASPSWPSQSPVQMVVNGWFEICKVLYRWTPGERTQ